MSQPTIAASQAAHLGIMTEIAAQMSDAEWNAFVATEKARRDMTAKPFEVNARVRFVMNTRPKKLALAPGTIVERKFYAGTWSYKVKLDNGLGTYVRVKRESIEAIGF